MMGFGYGNGYNMMGGWFGMMIIPIILIGVVIYVINNQGQKNNGKDIGFKDNFMDILNERFARGEINEEEYNTKKNIIKS
ncbi:SHOCT domain-containing protein [Clostridium bowmanii]|uniref:SHOCT domain-containing protein n=1 Tax=Clostridium bowmanii TaxID=132925 RepID=UPI001CD3AC3D|nr:SHOCT domain-containing protein [Clostridium bowmanii]MCA1073529.1 SHOCT domain-containing protein [Clostridium bowmanii]